VDFVVCTLAVKKKNQGRFRHVGSDHSLVSEIRVLWRVICKASGLLRGYITCTLLNGIQSAALLHGHSALVWRVRYEHLQ
jgi:hypothetical protein